MCDGYKSIWSYLVFFKSFLMIFFMNNISSVKVFTYEHHIRKCSYMNIIYGFFWKLHFSKNVRIWSYTVRHMIIELNHMWDSYTTPDYLHIPNPKMFTCDIIYEHHIPNFIYQLHIWKSHKSHVKSHTVVKTVVYDDHTWCSHVIIIYRSENVDCWTSYANIIYQHDSLSYVSIIYQSSYTNIIYHND